MLVLTRKTGQEIVIGDSVKVTVVNIRGGRVKLGCSGPKEVKILRKELDRRKTDDSLLNDSEKEKSNSHARSLN